jgi:hypothetical protein
VILPRFRLPLNGPIQPESEDTRTRSIQEQYGRLTKRSDDGNETFEEYIKKKCGGNYCDYTWSPSPDGTKVMIMLMRSEGQPNAHIATLQIRAGTQLEFNLPRLNSIYLVDEHQKNTYEGRIPSDTTWVDVRLRTVHKGRLEQPFLPRPESFRKYEGDTNKEYLVSMLSTLPQEKTVTFYRGEEIGKEAIERTIQIYSGADPRIIYTDYEGSKGEERKVVVLETKQLFATWDRNVELKPEPNSTYSKWTGQKGEEQMELYTTTDENGYQTKKRMREPEEAMI